MARARGASSPHARCVLRRAWATPFLCRHVHRSFPCGVSLPSTSFYIYVEGHENGNLVSSNIVFVYGEEVDDFLNLKKEVFHAISVSSIQELHRRLEAEKTKVADLLARVEALENQ